MPAHRHPRLVGLLTVLILSLAVAGGVAHDLWGHRDAPVGAVGQRFEVGHDQPIDEVHVEPTAPVHVEACLVCPLRRAIWLDDRGWTPQTVAPPTATVGFPATDRAPVAPAWSVVRGRAPPIA